MTFTLNDKEYFVIDFDKYATVRMEEVASIIFNDSLLQIVNADQQFSLNGFLKGLLTSNNMRKGIALICWEKGDTTFDEEKYNERITEFEQLPIKTKKLLTPKVKDFFDGIGDSLTEDFQTFNGLFLKVAQTSTTTS